MFILITTVIMPDDRMYAHTIEITECQCLDSSCKVSLTDDNRFYENGNIVWNPNKYHGGAHIDYNNGRLDNQRDPAIGLGHELAHAADWIVNGELNNNTWNYDSYNNTIYRVSFAEIKACNIENQIRQEAGIPRRLYYSYRISNGVIIPFANTAIPKISTNIYQKKLFNNPF